MNTFKLIDLFSGAGGLSTGFIKPEFGGRFESVLAIDNDKAAVATYNANFGEHCVVANVEEWLSTNKVPLCDVVIGGPPCPVQPSFRQKPSGRQRTAI